MSIKSKGPFFDSKARNQIYSAFCALCLLLVIAGWINDSEARWPPYVGGAMVLFSAVFAKVEQRLKLRDAHKQTNSERV